MYLTKPGRWTPRPVAKRACGGRSMGMTKPGLRAAHLYVHTYIHSQVHAYVRTLTYTSCIQGLFVVAQGVHVQFVFGSCGVDLQPYTTSRLRPEETWTTKSP